MDTQPGSNLETSGKNKRKIKKALFILVWILIIISVTLGLLEFILRTVKDNVVPVPPAWQACEPLLRAKETRRVVFIGGSSIEGCYIKDNCFVQILQRAQPKDAVIINLGRSGA